MAIEAKIAKRIFKFNETELEDPNPAMTPEEVISFHQTRYPEFITSSYETDIQDDQIIYTIRTHVGTKG
jgi:PRTRC genetic system protein C